MKKSKNNNIILGFGYWVFEFGFSWCKGKVIYAMIYNPTTFIGILNTDLDSKLNLEC